MRLLGKNSKIQMFPLLKILYFPLKCLWHLRQKSSLFLQKYQAFRSDLRRPVQEMSLQMLFSSFPSESHISTPIAVVKQYLAGCFDLLGTGWISRHNQQDFLLDQQQYHREYSQTLRMMISPNYHLLNWQLDPRSGESGTAMYFWWNNTARTGVKGFDIKQPWELGRMQYLCEIAVLHVQKSLPEQDLWLFFKDSVLDFDASNPYDMGCQWGCSMDVAIRAVNLLTAYSLFQTAGVGGDNREFHSIFTRLIYLHGKHIWKNLEKQLYFTNNHYFADLCGLIFIGTALYQTSEGRKWFAFAVKEFRKELVKQFLSDGGNFEASSTYHVQVGEMVIFTLALLIGSGEMETWSEKEQQQTMTLVAGILELAQALVAPDGNLVQIGDNDSGIFLHLAPAWEKRGELPEENRRNIIGFVSAASVLLSRATKEQVRHPDAQLIRALLKEKKPPIILEHIRENEFKVTATSEIPELPFRVVKEFYIPKIEPELLQLKYFPDFGVAVWSAPNLWLSLFWGGPGQCDVGGHSHNDKLSMILFVDGKPVLNDPGSFCYTGDPVKRNLYRSVHSHPLAVSVSDSENEFAGCGLFAFPWTFNTKPIKVGHNELILKFTTQKKCAIRHVRINCNGSVNVQTITDFHWIPPLATTVFSDGYGK